MLRMPKNGTARLDLCHTKCKIHLLLSSLAKDVQYIATVKLFGQLMECHCGQLCGQWCTERLPEITAMPAHSALPCLMHTMIEGSWGASSKAATNDPPAPALMWSKKTKFKLETKTPSQFVRPVNSITEAEFQLSIPTGRLCSRTLKYCHILVLDVNLDAGTTGHETDIVSFVLSDLLTFLKVFKTNYTS